MKRVARRDDALDRFKGGISLVTAIGFLAGVIGGVSRITGHRLAESGLPNLAVAQFVGELNAVFFRTAAFGIPAAFLLYVLYRVAPRAFRRAATLLFLVLALLAATESRTLWGSADGSGVGTLLLVRRIFLLFACLGLARLFQETISFFRALQQLGSLRIVLLIVFLLAAANSGATINYTKNFPRGPNILLVTMSSVRPDHLGYSGYDRGTSPALDRIASKGIVFTSAYTPCPRAPQALASILTGREPRAHGVRRMWDCLPAGETTLAEVLADKGYVTAAFVGLPSPAGSSGMGQGFDRFFEGPDQDAEAVTSAAIRWIDRQEKRPFLAWVHYDGAEMPYAPPSGPGPGADLLYAGTYRSSFEYRPTRSCRVFGHEPLAAGDSARAVDFYDAEIRSVDDQIGRLIRRLEETDRIHDTLILLVGTNGESLGEHGYSFDHGDFLFDTCLHVPMILSAANLPTRVLTSQVRVIDLLPTVIDILHLPPIADANGRSLLGAVERPDEFPDLTHFAESEVSLFPDVNARRPVTGLGGKLHAVRNRGWKYVEGPRGAADAALYDLTADPGETTDQSSSFPEVVASLRAALEGWEASLPAPSNEEESPPPAWVFEANDAARSTPSAPFGTPR